MPELIATLSAKRESLYEDRKFFAALQGVDLDQSNESDDDAFERVRARAAARAAGKDPDSIDPNDITSLQGAKGAQLGFQLGIDMDYEVEG